MSSFQPSFGSIWRLYKHGQTCIPSLFSSSFHHLCLPTVNPMHKFLPCYSRTSCASLLWYSKESGERWRSAYTRRVNKRLRLARKVSLDKVRFDKAVSRLPSRFTTFDLHDVLDEEDDPVVCLELFNWASTQHRFEHDVSTVHKTIQKLGIAGMMDEMYDIVDPILALPNFGSVALYTTIIHHYLKARRLNKAVMVFNHMREVENSDCRPSITTYNLFFRVFIPRGSSTYMNQLYMDNMESLFRQMIHSGVEPDTFALNSMILGYVNSNHLDDALTMFHQMGVDYAALPDSFTYDHIIYGLCAESTESRTKNATELFDEMKGKGFIASAKTYDSLVSALAIVGEVDEALKCFWEMAETQQPADFITCKTLLDEFCRKGRADEALNLVKEFQEKRLVSKRDYKKLLIVVKGDFKAIGYYSDG